MSDRSKQSDEKQADEKQADEKQGISRRGLFDSISAASLTLTAAALATGRASPPGH